MDKLYVDLFNIVIGKEKTIKTIGEPIDGSIKSEVIHNRILDPFLNWDKKVEINGRTWGIREKQLEIRERELKLLINVLKEKDIKFLNLKGLAMYKYYKKNLKRQSNDYDFIVRDIDEYWKVHSILLENGYSMYYFPMFTYINKQLVGITKYHKNVDGYKIHIEINIGKLIISEISWFDNFQLWDTHDVYSYNEIDLNIPSDDINMLVLLIEVSGRKKIMIRDIADFYFLEKYGQINWDYINKSLNRHLSSVLNKLKTINNLLEDGKFDLNKIKIQGRKSEFKQILFQILNSKSNNKIKKLFYGYLKLTGDELIKKDKLLQVLKQIDYIMPPKDRFKIGIITHFIPIDNNLKGEINWLKYKKYNILITPIGTFLATNFGILNEEEELDIKMFINTKGK